MALFNTQSSGDNIDFANADDASPVISGEGQSQEVTVSVKGGKRLVLFVRDGGDGFEHDHAVWMDPVLHGPEGDRKLTELAWVIATSGWGAPRVNRTCEDQPLTVGGKEVSGIGTHSQSMILYDLPAGYETFTAKGVVTQSGSVVFGVLVDRGSQEALDEAEVRVDFSDLGMSGKANVRDLWSHKDLGTFEGNFSRKLPVHGAGLFRLTPTR